MESNVRASVYIPCMHVLGSRSLFQDHAALLNVNLKNFDENIFRTIVGVNAQSCFNVISCRPRQCHTKPRRGFATATSAFTIHTVPEWVTRQYNSIWINWVWVPRFTVPVISQVCRGRGSRVAGTRAIGISVSTQVFRQGCSIRPNVLLRISV